MVNPIQFLKEAKSEMTKVVWPARKEIVRITIAVIVLSVVVAIFLGIVDFGLTRLIEYIVEQR